MSDTTTANRTARHPGRTPILDIATQVVRESEDIEKRFPDNRFGPCPRSLDTCAHGDPAGLRLARYIIELHDQIEALEKVGSCLSVEGIRNADDPEHMRQVSYIIGFLNGLNAERPA